MKKPDWLQWLDVKAGWMLFGLVMKMLSAAVLMGLGVVRYYFLGVGVLLSLLVDYVYLLKLYTLWKGRADEVIQALGRGAVAHVVAMEQGRAEDDDDIKH